MNENYEKGYAAAKKLKSAPPHEYDVWKEHGPSLQALPDAEAREDWLDGFQMGCLELLGLSLGLRK